MDIADVFVKMLDQGEVDGIDECELGACGSVGIDLEQLESLTDLQVEQQAWAE